MSIERSIVIHHTRQNSGRHFLDSGDYYGRVYDTPAPESKFRVDDDGEVYLTLTGLLSEHATVEEEIKSLLDAAWGSGKRGEPTTFTTPDGVEHDATDLNVFEIGPVVMQAMGYECKSRDNTYNGETDLDQGFFWEVWTPVDSDSDDWIWAEDAVVLVYAHTGCDIRGGYATPIPVQFDGDYSLPVHLTLDFRAADEATEEWVTRHGHREDEFSQGYSSNPQYALQEVVGEFISHNPEDQTLTFKNPHEGDGEPESVVFGYDFWC